MALQTATSFLPSVLSARKEVSQLMFVDQRKERSELLKNGADIDPLPVLAQVSQLQIASNIPQQFPPFSILCSCK
jgi:hypothetical protein